MNSYTKINVAIEERIKEHITDNITDMCNDDVIYENEEEFYEYFQNTEYYYFMNGDWQVQEFLTENKINTIEYLSMCEELTTIGIEINPCDMANSINTYINTFISENSDRLFKFYVNTFDEYIEKQEKYIKEQTEQSLISRNYILNKVIFEMTQCTIDYQFEK